MNLDKQIEQRKSLESIVAKTTGIIAGAGLTVLSFYIPDSAPYMIFGSIAGGTFGGAVSYFIAKDSESPNVCTTGANSGRLTGSTPAGRFLGSIIGGGLAAAAGTTSCLVGLVSGYIGGSISEGLQEPIKFTKRLLLYGALSSALILFSAGIVKGYKIISQKRLQNTESKQYEYGGKR